jgi:hypothetical protein
VRITLLGAVEAWPEGSEQHPVSLGGLRLRGLLARLALDTGQPVAVSELVDDLWGDAPPEGAVNALQALVSRLRRAIGADLVDTAARGYQLRVEPEAVDALRFASVLTAADAADDTVAHALLGHALALWRGPALADVLDEARGPAQTADALTVHEWTGGTDRPAASVDLRWAGRPVRCPPPGPPTRPHLFDVRGDDHRADRSKD